LILHARPGWSIYSSHLSIPEGPIDTLLAPAIMQFSRTSLSIPEGPIDTRGGSAEELACMLSIPEGPIDTARHPWPTLPGSQLSIPEGPIDTA